MKLLIIRHADPDYSVDGLTEVGKIEAEALVPRLKAENISAIYCSPLGRARLTAEPTAKALGLEPEIKEYLREFNHYKIALPYLDEPGCAWDLLPEFTNRYELLFDKDRWRECDFLRGTPIPDEYDRVIETLDAILEKHGYKREGYNYRAVKPNHDTIAIFCHYGVTAVLLSHLMNCSPYTLWQNAVTTPSSVTVAYTEERREGIASIRVAAIGDTSHLYAIGREPSFSARFCECFTDDTRHD